MKSESEIFEAAAGLPVSARPAWLDAACVGRPEARARIEALLSSHDSHGIMADIKTLMDCQAVAQTPLQFRAESNGQRIGRYRLLQQIGEGGFGVVWMAEQTEPVIRRVALKITKAGMDTREVIARFEAERQALAMMDHANIAKVLDAGATDRGRPFFVMELVGGIPITQFCDEHEFTIRQRLELFAEVCSGINHAHQKGIIHRDLKPSNVLVMLQGGKPVPKVIDFGIAKAIEGRLTDKTLSTRFEQFMGTPAYMSPEQTPMSGLDIDTRSDIYGLGVLLYELLTGNPPFDSKSLLADGYEEMRRIIREVEPQRPSVRLSSVAGSERFRLARSRQVAAEKLARLIEPDLDWMVMKAIEKDRTRRYETANGFALDIHRFLTDEPVSATPPTTGYRVRKFARRNKVPLRAAAAVAAALTCTAVLSSWNTAGIAAVLIAATTASTLLAVRALQAEKAASHKITSEKAARSDAEAVAAFFEAVFRSPDHTRDGRDVTVAELLDRTAARLEDAFAGQPVRQALLHGVLGRTYHALGLYREAIPLLETGRNHMQRTFGFRHLNSLNSMRDLAVSYQAAGRWSEALELLEEVLNRNREFNGLEHAETLTSMTNLAEFCYLADRPLKALEIRKTVLTLLRRSKGEEDPLTLSATFRLAESMAGTGDLVEEALKLEASAVELGRRILGAQHPDTMFGLHVLGHCLEQSGARGEALKIREEELVLRERVHGRDHSATLHCLMDLAGCYYNIGRIDDALRMRSEALSRCRGLLGSGHPHTVQTALETAMLHASAGHRERALHLLVEVAARPVQGTAELLTIAALQAWLNLDSDLLATCRRMFQRGIGSDEPPSVDRAAKACCLRPLQDAKLVENALAFARNAVDQGRKSPDLPRYYLGLGMAELRHGNHGSAAENLSAAESGAKKLKLASERASIGDTARCFRVICLFGQGRKDEARRLFAATEMQVKPVPVDGQPYCAVLTRDDLILWLAFKEAEAMHRNKGLRLTKAGKRSRFPTQGR